MSARDLTPWPPLPSPNPRPGEGEISGGGAPSPGGRGGDGRGGRGVRSPRYAARLSVICSSASAVRADRGRSCHGWPGSDGGRGGASSSTAWALVPPSPSELTPARRGAAPRGHGVSSPTTRKALL